MFKKVIFYGTVVNAYVPSMDLWDVLASKPKPSDKHILAQISEDAPWRWVIPLDMP